LVQHRATEGADPSESAKKGYVSQAHIIALAEAAGLVFEASSEINANPMDTKDYEKGVWTLPPSLTLGEQDQDKYLAIGESDRMTLRFRRPAK
jgi:predicted methyltransferase